MDVQRLSPSENATDATIRQVTDFVGALGISTPAPLFVFDAGYDPIALGDALSTQKAQILVRIRSKRVFHFDPAPAVPGPGRPPRHGGRFVLADQSTWSTPDAEAHAHDPRYGDMHVQVQVWHGLHPRLTKKGGVGERQARYRLCAAASFASSWRT